MIDRSGSPFDATRCRVGYKFLLLEILNLGRRRDVVTFREQIGNLRKSFPRDFILQIWRDGKVRDGHA